MSNPSYEGQIATLWRLWSDLTAERALSDQLAAAASEYIEIDDHLCPAGQESGRAYCGAFNRLRLVLQAYAERDKGEK